MYKRFALTFACLYAIAGSMTPGIALAGQDTSYEEKEHQAKALLVKAVDAFELQGQSVLAAISRQGAFTAQDAYVYVLDTRGVMLASGGPSAVYIGRDIRPMLGKDMQTALNEALTTPEDGVIHSREYHWTNWADGKVERKRVYFKRLGDKVFAAGYFIPRSSPKEAQRLLDDSVSAMDSDKGQTLAKINRLDPYFNRDDLYVFVIDESSSIFVAHGVDRRLVGTSIQTLRDADGQLIGPRILNALKNSNKGDISYTWRNPVTGNKELKHTLLRRQGNDIVAVGYFSQ